MVTRRGDGDDAAYSGDLNSQRGVGRGSNPQLAPRIETPGPHITVAVHREALVGSRRYGHDAAQRNGATAHHLNRGARIAGAADPKLTVGIIPPSPYRAVILERKAVRVTSRNGAVVGIPGCDEVAGGGAGLERLYIERGVLA